MKRREGAGYISFASIVLSFTVIIEALYFQKLLPFGQVTPYGFLTFIFVQVVLIAARFSKNFQRIETLSGELEKVNDSLKQSERKYRHIFEDSKDMIFLAGLNAQIEDVSPVCREVLGYTKKELQQMKIMDLIVNPEMASRIQKTISDRVLVKDLEVELLRKDGRKIDTLVAVTLRQNEHEEVIGLQSCVRDITIRKQAEIERLRALKVEKQAKKTR